MPTSDGKAKGLNSLVDGATCFIMKGSVMASNSTLNQAKLTNHDEYYTRYNDIQTELNHYEKHFKGKTVLCNCDDPFESNFCKFFLRNFNYLGLKRLICTSYVSSPVIGSQMMLWDMEEKQVKRGNGYVMDISEVPMKNGRGVSDDDIERLLKSKKRGVKKLTGNGDFRSDECVEYLKQADIVVTNPPFSMFREYMQIVMEHQKKFLLVSNPNALHYKEIFPLIRNNLVWVGYKSMSSDMLFDVAPEFAEWLVANKKQGSGYRIVDGVVKGRAQAIWLTNLDIKKRHEDLILYKKYTPEAYPKFDNFDAINVNRVSDIPCDYFGYMGVPDSYMEYYNADQFEILGRSGDTDWVLNECEFFTPPTGERLRFYKKYNRTWRVQNVYLLDEKELPVIVYSRLFIRRKHKK